MDIRTSCLGVLALNDASGYEIRKMFEDGPFSVFAEGGFGSIYPALKKLEAENLVTSETLDQDNRPQKKVYKITTKGRIELIEKLSEPPVADKYKSDFLFSMFFAEYLSPAFVETTIDQKLKSYREKIEHIESKECRADDFTDGQKFVHAFGLHMNKAAHDFLEENKHIAIAAALTGKRDDKHPQLKEAAE